MVIQSNLAIVIGYGNHDRQDDGIAWHVLKALAERLGMEVSDRPVDPISQLTDSPCLMYVPQLTPELLDLLVHYDQICFIDTHTGSFPLDMNVISVEAEFHISPLSHHLTPSMLLAIGNQLSNWQPQAILLTIRGYEFNYCNKLSDQAKRLVEPAVEYISHWLGYDRRGKNG